MKVGIIGSEGIVGSTIRFGMSMLGHEIFCYDIRLAGSKLENVLQTDLIFVCVPTPMLSDGACDTSIVEDIVVRLSEKNFYGVCVIKSTVIPGTCQRLQKLVKFEIVHSPEFLRQRVAISDFTEHQDLLVIGTENERAFETVKEVHGRLPKKVVKLTPTEAEFVKYMNNAYGAMLVVFANSFFELCKQFSVNYTNVKNALTLRDSIPDNYLICNDDWRGYISYCWDKDVPALNKLAEKIGIDFFRNITEQNDKFVKTLAPGTRKAS